MTDSYSFLELVIPQIQSIFIDYAINKLNFPVATMNNI